MKFALDRDLYLRQFPLTLPQLRLGPLPTTPRGGGGVALPQRPGVCGLRLYVERDNTRAQKTYRQCGLVDPGYFVMEDDFSGAVAHLRS